MFLRTIPRSTFHSKPHDYSIHITPSSIYCTPYTRYRDITPAKRYKCITTIHFPNALDTHHHPHHNTAPTTKTIPNYKLHPFNNLQSTTTFQHSTALSFKSMSISSTKTFQCMLAQLAAEYPTCNLQPNLPNIYFHLFFCFPGMYSTSSVSSQV